MSVLAPPEPPATIAERAPERRRRWPWVVGIALLVIALISAGYLATLSTPLTLGSWIGVGAAGTKSVPDLGPADPGASGWQVPYHEGERFRYGFSLRNAGPIGATITGIDPNGFGSASMVSFDALFMIESANLFSTAPGDLVPFQPFSLGPGQERAIVIQLRMNNCALSSPDTSMTIVSTPVRFRLLGISRTTWVDLGAGIRIDSPPDVSCPGRPPSVR